MIEYVTCTDCLDAGKPNQILNCYPNDNVVASFKCPHCGSFINQDETKTLT